MRDDVLDDSPLRRGAVTAHERHADDHRARNLRGEPRRYGEGVANLAADLAHVYADRLTRALSEDARAVWDETRVEVTVGQYLDIAVAAEGVADPDSPLDRGVQVGALHHPPPPPAGRRPRGPVRSRRRLRGVRAAAGRGVLQLRVNLIDAFGDSEDTGKPTGLDFDRFKMSYLLSLAVRRDERIRELAAAPAGPDGAARMRDLLVATGVADEVEQRIAQLVDQARRAVADAPLVPRWRTELMDLTRRVAYRDRWSRTSMERTLIIGLGRAGLGLHWAVLRRLRAAGEHPDLFDPAPVLTLDPLAPAAPPRGEELRSVSSVAQARGLLDPERTVVHLCTPPVARLGLLRELAGAGFAGSSSRSPWRSSAGPSTTSSTWSVRSGCAWLSSRPGWRAR